MQEIIQTADAEIEMTLDAKAIYENASPATRSSGELEEGVLEPRRVSVEATYVGKRLGKVTTYLQPAWIGKDVYISVGKPQASSLKPQATVTRAGWDLILKRLYGDDIRSSCKQVDTSKCKPSSNIENIYYSSDLCLLAVTFKGGTTYGYGNVDADIAARFEAERDSLGILLGQTVKADPDRYPAIKLLEAISVD